MPLEDQKRDEEITSIDVGCPTSSDIESVAYASGGGFVSEDFDPPTFSMQPVPGQPAVLRPVLNKPIQVYIGDPPRECPECVELGHTDCWESAYRAGREDAARLIVDHADEFAPADGNVQQRRMRRHLMIASRVAAPKLTMDEIGEAIKRGDYVACDVPDGDPAGVARGVSGDDQDRQR